jgi:putative MATE family efflux protein
MAAPAENRKQAAQEKLGTMSIGRLLVTMSVPMMISMFIQALYNAVDSMFVARLSEDALTAVSLALPLQNIMIALAVGTGVGVNALVSRSLGEGNRRRAEKAANVQVFIDTVYALLCVVLGLLFSRRFFQSQTDVESIIEYGAQYVSIITVFSLGMFQAQGLEKLLIATGNATPSMISQGLGAILNIILDPIFIFAFGLGVRGAAIATVIGQFAAAICALIFNWKRNTATRFDFRQMLPDLRILKFIYSIGFPSMITVGLHAVTGYLLNGIYLSFSTTATAVYGIWIKLQSFGFMPVFGMNNGTLAIYSYNYGARKLDRLFQTLRLSVIVGAVITLAVTILYELIPVPLLRLFNASEYMLSIGVTAVRRCALSMTFGAVTVILTSSFQALGRSKFALMLNILRQVVIQVAAAWALSRLGRLEPVWFSPLISEVLTLIVAAFLCRTVIAKVRAEAGERPIG